MVDLETYLHPMNQVLYNEESDIQQIVVVQEPSGIRRLCLGDGIGREQGAIDINDPMRHVNDYSKMAMSSLVFFDEKDRPDFCGQTVPLRVLVLGLGVGAIPSALRYYKSFLNIDVAEIDYKVWRVAEEFFGFQIIERENAEFQQDHLVVNVSDGRKYILGHLEDMAHDEYFAPYDLIILDAYNTDGLVPDLSTKEFYETCKKALTPNGVFAVNLFRSGDDFFKNLNTLRAGFNMPMYDYFNKEEMPLALSNHLIFVTNSTARDKRLSSILRVPTPIMDFEEDYQISDLSSDIFTDSSV